MFVLSHLCLFITLMFILIPSVLCLFHHLTEGIVADTIADDDELTIDDVFLRLICCDRIADSHFGIFVEIDVVEITRSGHSVPFKLEYLSEFYPRIFFKEIDIQTIPTIPPAPHIGWNITDPSSAT